MCINGPCFSTRMESEIYKQWGANIVEMTSFPEAYLIREAQSRLRECRTLPSHHARLWTVTDLDSEEGEHRAEQNSINEISKRIAKGLDQLLLNLIEKPLVITEQCKCDISPPIILNL